MNRLKTAPLGVWADPRGLGPYDACSMGPYGIVHANLCCLNEASTPRDAALCGAQLPDGVAWRIRGWGVQRVDCAACLALLAEAYEARRT